MPPVTTFQVLTTGRGFFEITKAVQECVNHAGTLDGTAVVFIQHTSASLIIFENADPTAKADMEAWMSRLVRDGDPAFTHRDEAPDDMSSHIRATLTATSITIPVLRGRLALGRWQGIYVWEHRTSPHTRNIVVACQGNGRST